jgi:hypothetical protein
MNRRLSGKELCPQQNRSGLEWLRRIKSNWFLAKQRLSITPPSQIDSLLEVSARIGRKPLLIRDLLCADVYRYREVVEDNGTRPLPFQQCKGFWSAEETRYAAQTIED